MIKTRIIGASQLQSFEESLRKILEEESRIGFNYKDIKFQAVVDPTLPASPVYTALVILEKI